VLQVRLEADTTYLMDVNPTEPIEMSPGERAKRAGRSKYPLLTRTAANPPILLTKATLTPAETSSVKPEFSRGIEDPSQNCGLPGAVHSVYVTV
jgi:hypothetical protein